MVRSENCSAGMPCDGKLSLASGEYLYSDCIVCVSPESIYAKQSLRLSAHSRSTAEVVTRQAQPTCGRLANKVGEYVKHASCNVSAEQCDGVKSSLQQALGDDQQCRGSANSWRTDGASHVYEVT